jgi:hypothetical protein
MTNKTETRNKMTTNPIAIIKNPALLSRFERLAVETSFLIDASISGGLTLARGVLMAKIVSSGKYRPYVEGVVKTGGAFATSSAAFTLDVSQQVGPVPFQVGDVIEDVSGNALGTIASYNALTGVGALAANSAEALAAGGFVRVALASLALAYGAGKILKDEAPVDSANDTLAVGYFEGFFIQANTTVSAAALLAMQGKTIDAGEIRLV